MKYTLIIFILIIYLFKSNTLFGGTYQNLVDAFNKKEITYEQYLEYNIYNLAGKEGIPKEYMSTEFSPVKCYTNLIIEIQKNRELLNDNAKLIFTELKTRPTKQYTFDSPNGYYKIHYDKTGDHAVLNPDEDTNPADGHPDFVNRAAEYHDYVWQTEVIDMGYLSPPSDGSNGGDSKYDIYLHHFSGAYGVCFPESYIGSPNPSSYSSYIFIDPTFDGFPNTPLENLQVTAAHEFHHAIQMTYDVFESSWYKEITSTWIEDIVYDDVNDYYNYLGSFYSQPEISLSATNGVHEYAACIFNHYLSQTHGDSIIKDIWENLVGINDSEVYSALNTLLPLYGSSRDFAFTEFTVWNYLTGVRRSNSYSGYEEGEDYPNISIQKYHHTYPVSLQEPDYDLPDYFGSNYIVFNSLPDSGTMLIGFEGDLSVDWGLSVVTNRNGIYDYQIVNTFGFESHVSIESIHEVSEVALIPAITSTTGSNRPYSYFSESFYSDTLFLKTETYTIVDTSLGNSNNRLDAGETVSLFLTFKNYGQQVDSVHTLLTSLTPGVNIDSGEYVFDRVGKDSLVTNDLPFTISCDDTVTASHSQIKISYSLAGQTVLTDEVRILLGIPGLLIVDDDNGLDFENQLLADLDSLEKTYEILTIDELNMPNLFLENRQVIIWSLGSESAQIDSFQTEIEQYLANGGRLIITGDNVNTVISDSIFKAEILHFIDAGSSTSQILKGEAGDPIGNSEYMGLSVSSPKMINPSGSPFASKVFSFSGQSGAGVIKYEYDDYKLVVFSFSFNNIVNNNPSFLNSKVILERTLNWIDLPPSNIDYKNSLIPNVTYLSQNYPNPFNPITKIKFSLGENSKTELVVYDIMGKKIKSIINGYLRRNTYELSWDSTNDYGKKVASGIYYLKLKTDNSNLTKKMILIR